MDPTKNAMITDANAFVSQPANSEPANTSNSRIGGEFTHEMLEEQKEK